jgi:hypothetical protein
MELRVEIESEGEGTLPRKLSPKGKLRFSFGDELMGWSSIAG